MFGRRSQRRQRTVILREPVDAILRVRHVVTADRKDTVVGGELGAIEAVMEVVPNEVDRLFLPTA